MQAGAFSESSESRGELIGVNRENGVEPSGRYARTPTVRGSGLLGGEELDKKKISCIMAYSGLVYEAFYHS